MKCAVTVRQAGAKAVRPAANATTIQPARSAAKPAWNAQIYINVLIVTPARIAQVVFAQTAKPAATVTEIRSVPVAVKPAFLVKM